MITHWIPLALGLCLGLIPPRFFITKECRYLRFDAVWTRIANPLKTQQRRRRWWKLPIVWIDPVRGAVVGYLLTHGFDPEPLASGFAALLPFIATIACMALVLWVQTSGREKDRETISPCGFLAGMMITTQPPVVALSAIAMGVSTAIMMSRFSAGYFVAAATTAGIGYLIIGKSIWVVAHALLVASPLLIAWLRRTSLVMPVRC